MSAGFGVVSPERLARAVHLAAVRTGRGRYRVTGGAGAHVVTAAGEVLRCDCADAAMRYGGPCKHALCILLRRGHPDVLLALRALVPMPKRPRRLKAAA